MLISLQSTMELITTNKGKPALICRAFHCGRGTTTGITTGRLALSSEQASKKKKQHHPNLFAVIKQEQAATEVLDSTH